MVESKRVAEDSGSKAEGVESSDRQDLETMGEIKGEYQLLGYIIHFANMVDLYQKKNRNYFGCGSPDHIANDCPNDLSKTAQRGSLNAKEGMMKKGSQTPQKPVVTQLTSPDKAHRA